MTTLASKLAELEARLASLSAAPAKATGPRPLVFGAFGSYKNGSFVAAPDQATAAKSFYAGSAAVYARFASGAKNAVSGAMFALLESLKR